MRYGRRPPKNAPALRLGRILSGKIPDHPIAQDNLGLLSDWAMLGNDVAGDCVAVTWANFRRLVTTVLAGSQNYPSQDQVWAIYQTQNPTFDPNGSADTNGPGSDADQGMEIQTLLEYLVKVGGPDGVKALAFAKVNPASREEVKAAIAIFGGVWTGLTVLNSNMTDFGRGRPWDYNPASPVDGGHSVLSGGYSGNAASDVTFITWATETSFTDAYWQNEVEEAWVVLWPEHLGSHQFEAGVDLAALAADYTALTGKPFPNAPQPQPAPAPQPVPVPDPPAPVPPAPTPEPVPIPTPVPVPTPSPTPDPPVGPAVHILTGNTLGSKVASFLAIQDSGPEIVHYVWDFGDGHGAAGSSAVQHTYAQFGPYLVQVTVKDVTGTAYSFQQFVTLQDHVQAPPFPITQVDPWLYSRHLTGKSKQAAAAIRGWLTAGGS